MVAGDATHRRRKLRAGPAVPIVFHSTDPVPILEVIAALRQVIEPPQPKPIPSPFSGPGA